MILVIKSVNFRTTYTVYRWTLCGGCNTLDLVEYMESTAATIGGVAAWLGGKDLVPAAAATGVAAAIVQLGSIYISRVNRNGGYKGIYITHYNYNGVNTINYRG